MIKPEQYSKLKSLLFLLNLCPLTLKLSGEGSLKVLERKKAPPLRLISLRFKPPFQKGLENSLSGVAKKICLKCWRKSTKKLHLQG